MSPELLELVARVARTVLGLSIHAVPVVVLVLVVQRVLRGVLSASVRSYLWLLPAMYLALPWLPTSRFSMHRWFSMAEAGWSPAVSDRDAGAVGENRARAVVAEPASARTLAVSGAERAPRPWSQGQILAVIWLAGFAGVGLRILAGVIATRKLLRTGIPCLDPQTLAVLGACKTRAGVSRDVELWRSEEVHGPVVMGVFTPRIVLPESLFAEAGAGELGHVLMHELAHVRRHDIPQAWLMGCLLAVHWFNPFVWLAAWRQRVDRELACDAFVLDRTPEEPPVNYGRTLIHLLEQCHDPAVLANTAGIIEYKTEIAKRIKMITEHKNTPAWKHVCSILVCAGLACFVLNRPVELKANEPPAPAIKIETTTSAEGRWEDTINFPFVMDDELVGSWTSVDFVADPARFVPGRPQLPARELFLKNLEAFPDGSTSRAWTWTKHYLLDPWAKTASRYEVMRMGEETYLSLEWKSGDYTIRHMKPMYYIFKKVSAQPTSRPARIVDNIDLPFVDDPEVGGTVWESVDFVNTPDEFSPGRKKFAGLLTLDLLVFKRGGAMHRAWFAWTKGVVMHRDNRTASRYEIRKINGEPYMFFEWKSGDYTIRHMKPKYYVLKKAG